ncbi:MAG: hypothetical protein ABI760_20885 [Ferruginibacter sp.]
MKKIVFAIQVFSLLAMFPVIVILEMNHATRGLHENNPSPGVTEQVKSKSIDLFKSSSKKNEDGLFMPAGTILLREAF